MLRLKNVTLLSVLITAVVVAGPITSTEAKSKRHCQQVAHSYAKVHTGGNVVGVAMTGGLIGGAIGSFSGNFGRWALIGGGIGAVTGLVGGSYIYDRLYRHAYNYCRTH